MNILGLNIEEYCSAALMKNGEIVAASSEERFRREKGYSGFPTQSVDYCLKTGGITINDIDIIAVGDLGATIAGIVYSYVQRRSRFSVGDYVREAKEYWYPKLYEGKDVNYLDVFKDKLCPETFPEKFNTHFLKEIEKYKTANIHEIQALKKRLITTCYPQIDERKIHFFPHHEIHAFYGYYASKFVEERNSVLVVTADSWGDYENGMISRFYDGKFEILHAVDNHNLGWLFRNITLLLGMKPYDHEYKVMGLAAYAPEYLSKLAYNVFSSTMFVDGVNFKYDENPKDNYFWFKERLDGIRFDGIAGGLQRYFEGCIQKWIGNAVKKYGIKKVCFSGGLAMNIKANMKLGQMAEIDDFFVAASPDDNANCIGVCFLAMYREMEKNKGQKGEIKALKKMYLGPDISNEEVLEAIRANNLTDFCEIEKEVNPEFVAGKLADGIIIGRSAGRMEFGARALGNRSILADPRNLGVVDRINRIIKKRDFWMPFAPVIIDTYWEKYLVNKNHLYSPFMTIGFETTEAGRKDMVAGIHSADKTARPQMLTRETNPYYYDVIKNFEKLTGVGALLNTSFNLHGYPIVMTANDAVNVFLNSDLDALLLNNAYIEKKRKS